MPCEFFFTASITGGSTYEKRLRRKRIFTTQPRGEGLPVGAWGYTLRADRAAGEGRQRTGAGASAQVEFVEHVGAATELVDDEEDVAHIYVDTALEGRIELEVA